MIKKNEREIRNDIKETKHKQEQEHTKIMNKERGNIKNIKIKEKAKENEKENEKKRETKEKQQRNNKDITKT